MKPPIHPTSRRADGRLIPRLRRASAACAAAALLSLAGCGGDDSTTTTDYGSNFAAATGLIGQNSFTDYLANRGGAAGATTLSSPGGSVATTGSLFYVTDTGNNRILGYTSVPTSSNTPAAFVLGQTSLTGTAPTTSATGLAQPSKVSTDGTHLVVTDSNNNRVLIWNTLPTATGTPPDVVVGQSSFTTNTGGLSASAFTFPSGAMIANGKLVVVDQKNNRVLVWNTVPTTNGAAANVVLGQPNFTSNTSGYYDNTNNAGLTRLTGPSDLWTDGFRLLVSDTGNNRVLYWKLIPSSNDVPNDIIIGQTSNTRITAGTTNNLFNAPIGVGSDGQQVYVADTANNRVLVFPSFPVATGTAASRVIGQGDFTHSAYNDEYNNSNGQDTQDGQSDGNPTARTLHTPIGVASDGARIYVTDRDNHRVLYFAP